MSNDMMFTPNHMRIASKVCEHGQLARQCPICELNELHEAERQRDNLLARIFRDGGQKQDSFKTRAEACRTAESLVVTYIHKAEKADRLDAILSDGGVTLKKILRDADMSMADSMDLPWPDFHRVWRERLLAAIDAALRAPPLPAQPAKDTPIHEQLVAIGESAPEGTWEKEDYVLVPREPSEEMWGGLARDLVMWRDMDRPPTGAFLYRHLGRLGRAIPEWLRAEIPDTEHVPPKGSVAVCIYKAMIAAALTREKE